MKTNFLKTAYALLVALIVTFQLVAAPLALTAGANDQLELAREGLNGDCQHGACGGA
jgi:hypothetical protein